MADLAEEARTFAQSLTTLLNGTVCNGVRITSVILPAARNRAILANRIRPSDLDPTHAMPACLGRDKPKVHIGLSYRLELDEQGHYPMVTSSFVGLFVDEAMTKLLVHWDYERNKPDDYPEAHFQCVADSDHWRELLPPGELEKLHFPVGGRRYRPCLEDVVEFMIRESLAKGREGWRTHVEAGRADFHSRQMRAAIRRDPQSAIDVLRELGHL